MASEPPREPAWYRSALMLRNGSAFLLLVLAGCGHTRQVTPWLRSSFARPFELWAESGGTPATARIERKVAGRWEVLSTSSSCALSLAGGIRAVYETNDNALAVVSEVGTSTLLDCAGRLRARPGGHGLVCLEMDWWVSDPAQPLVVVVKTFTDSGVQEGAAQTLVLPGSSEPRNYFTHFVGFLDGQPVLSVHVNNATDDLWPGVAKRCALYVTSGEQWQLKASLTSSAWADCSRADFWSSRAPLPIQSGDAPAGTDSDAPCH